MNKYLPNENLIELIKSNARETSEARQMSRRLRELLGQRIRKIFLTLKKAAPNQLTQSELMRLTLCRNEYIQHLDELSEFSHRATRSRINYETYMMLYNARKIARRR